MSSRAICDSDSVTGVGAFLLALDVEADAVDAEIDSVDVEANAACAWASISCFGKSCDGHSKWTQWNICFYLRKRREEIR